MCTNVTAYSYEATAEVKRFDVRWYGRKTSRQTNYPSNNIMRTKLRRADKFPVTAAEFTAEGTANILVNKYIPLWGRPRTMLSDNSLQFCSKLSQAVYQLLRVRKLATGSYHPSGNGGVERLNHTMAQMLAMVVNERQDDWDLRLPRVEFAYNNSVSAATGLTPDEVHMGGLPRLPLTVFERTGGPGHQSLAATTWPIATWLQTDSSARTILFANTMPSPFLALTAETPPSPTHCVRHLNLPWVDGHGCTTLPPPSARL